MTEDEIKGIVSGVLLGLKPTPALDEALRGLEEDNHNWSPRPCATCRGISRVLGRTFGCENPKVNRSR